MKSSRIETIPLRARSHNLLYLFDKLISGNFLFKTSVDAEDACDVAVLSDLSAATRIKSICFVNGENH